KRIERLPANSRRDAELGAKVSPFVTGMKVLLAQLTRTSIPPALLQLRWMIEEYRASLFDQELKTVMNASDHRLRGQLEGARVGGRGWARSREVRLGRGLPVSGFQTSRLVFASEVLLALHLDEPAGRALELEGDPFSAVDLRRRSRGGNNQVYASVI